MHKIQRKKYLRRHHRDDKNQNKYQREEKANIPPSLGRSIKRRKIIAPLLKTQNIIKKRTVTLFVGNAIPIGINSFNQIVDRGFTFLNKTLLISEFLDCNANVSIIVRPRRFGKTINISMLKFFLSVPNYPDNVDYRRELFKDTKVAERLDLFEKHFCKHPVICFSLKSCDNCKSWKMMQDQLHEELMRLLYQEHKYVFKSLSDDDKKRFKNILAKDEYTINNLSTLYDLSRWLNNYHRQRCILLIDEYDYPLDISSRFQYYEEACGFFTSMFGMVFKDNDENVERALLVGKSRIAKSENEVSVIIQHHNLEDHFEEVKQWYGGYEAGNGILIIYSPWSVNSFKIYKKALKPYCVDTGCTTTIKKLLWRLSEVIQDQIAELFLKGAIKASLVMDEIDYDLLSSQFACCQAIWTLLYYEGYLTIDRNKFLRIPNKEIEMEWNEWLQVKCQCSCYSVDSMLDMLLRGDLAKFQEYLPKLIMEMLSFYDIASNQAEFGYHLFMIGLLAQVQFRGYRIRSNREEGLGRFDLRIDPELKDVEYEISIIMEFKVLKKGKNIKDVHKSLQDSAKEELAQILEKKYRSGIPARSTRLVECGIALNCFPGKAGMRFG